MAETRIGIIGAGGRMGQALARAIAETDGARLAGGVEKAGSALIGKDIGALAGLDAAGVAITDNVAALIAASDALVDFSSPAATVEAAALAGKARVAHVVGTTGLSEADNRAIERAAKDCPIVQAANMSLGVNLLIALVRQAAARLDPSFDIEIFEMHHRHKVDAPSGTALALGRAAAEGRKVDLGAAADRGRDGVTGPRRKGAIGFSVARGGNVAGDHTVIFAADDERIELSHKAGDRMIFARGAVKAALWAHGRKPGLYSMADVLGFSF